MPDWRSILRRSKGSEESVLSPDVAAPLHSDWSWRPGFGDTHGDWVVSLESGAALGEVKVFHDCPENGVSVRSGFGGIDIELNQFKGGFASLVVDLPASACAGLTHSHLLRLEVATTLPPGTALFGRLNLRQGPNTDQILRKFEPSHGEMPVDFDLTLADLDVARVTAAWVDVIFETSGGVRINVEDVAMSRRPRAEL